MLSEGIAAENKSFQSHQTPLSGSRETRPSLESRSSFAFFSPRQRSGTSITSLDGERNGLIRKGSSSLSMSTKEKSHKGVAYNYIDKKILKQVTELFANLHMHTHIWRA